MTITVKATYDGAKIVPDSHAEIERFKASLKPGASVALKMQPWGRSRTLRQSRLLHGMIGRYCRAHGESLAYVKVRWKCDLGWYLPAAPILAGDIDMPRWRGRFVDLHDVYPDLYAERTIILLRSEADYTTRMEAEFVEYAIKHCLESGVDIADILAQLEEHNEQRRDTAGGA
jgi:hypothetical protein